MRVGCEASHPNSRCRATDSRLCKAYNASAMVARLVCSNSLLLVYLEGLFQDLSSTAPAEGSEAVVEMLCVVDILICGARDQALGQAIASLVQARHQVWLALSKLTPQDCSAVLAAPVVRWLMRLVQRTPAVSRPWPSGRYVWGHGGGALRSVPLSTRRVSGPGPTSGSAGGTQGFFRGRRRTGSPKAWLSKGRRRAPVALSRDCGIVGKRGSNAPALGRDGAGVLFGLFPHTKEGRGPSAHSETEGVQPVSEASAFSDAFPLTEARRLVHHSGPPRCLFPHSHSQGAQEIPPFPFSRKVVRAQGSPLWPVTGSPHLYKMYGRGTHSSPAPGCSHIELPGRLVDMCPFGAAGEERHRGSAGPSLQAGLGLKQGKKLPYSFEDGNLSRLGVGFERDERLFDPQEALRVERTFVPLQCDEAGDREVWPEAARAVGGSHPGGPIGAAPHAPAAAVVCPAQSEPLGGWPAASPLGARLPGSLGMVAYNSGPSGGCSHRSGMFQSHNIYRRLHEGLGRSVPGLFSPGSVETLLERGSCEPTRIRGSALGVDVLSASVPGEVGPHQDRQFCGGFLYQPPGGYALSGASQRSSQASFVGAGSQSLLESGVPAREGQCGRRSSVQGRPPSRGMAAPPSHHAGHLGPFRLGSGGPLCLPGDYSLPLVVFHDRPQGHIGGGCPRVHMAPGSSVRFSPLPSSASGAGPSEDVAGQGASGGPGLASSALEGRASDNAGGDPLASPGQAGHALAGTGPAVASEPRVWSHP